MIPPRVLRNGGKRSNSAEIQTSEDEVDGLATSKNTSAFGEFPNAQISNMGLSEDDDEDDFDTEYDEDLYETSTSYGDRQKCWSCNKQVNTNSSVAYEGFLALANAIGQGGLENVMIELIAV